MQMHLLVHVIIITITIITVSVIIERGGEPRLPTRDGEGRFFSQGGAGQGQCSTGQGRVRQGSKYAGAGGGQGAYCVYQISDIIC